MSKPDSNAGLPAEFQRMALDKNIATTVFVLARHHGKREAFKTLAACVAALKDDNTLTYDGGTK
jgi:hypothetical protein